MKPDKLIKDYEAQIEVYDDSLQSIKEREREIREELKQEYDGEREDLYQERQIINAQRQRTVQFISDLKDLK